MANSCLYSVTLCLTSVKFPPVGHFIKAPYTFSHRPSIGIYGQPVSLPLLVQEETLLVFFSFHWAHKESPRRARILLSCRGHIVSDGVTGYIRIAIKTLGFDIIQWPKWFSDEANAADPLLFTLHLWHKWDISLLICKSSSTLGK